MRYDPATPCSEVDEVFGGTCGATPTGRYLTGPKCRPHAPGATLHACMHGTVWTEVCARCDGAPVPPPTGATVARGPARAYGPSADYGNLTVPMQQGRKNQIRRWTEPAHRSLTKQRTDLNNLAQQRALR